MSPACLGIPIKVTLGKSSVCTGTVTLPCLETYSHLYPDKEKMLFTRKRKIILRPSKIILHLFARLQEMQAFYFILHLRSYLSLHYSMAQATPTVYPSCECLVDAQVNSLDIYRCLDHSLLPFQPSYRPWHLRQLLWAYH